MGLTAGLTVAAATAQAGVTTTLAASCGAPTTRSYNAPASRSSCGAPSSQNNNNSQASNYNSCGAPKSYGYDNNTADNSANRSPSWSNAAESQPSQYTPAQGQPNQGWTSQTNQGATPGAKSSGYYYNGQNQTAPNGQMNPNSTTNPVKTQSGQWSNQGTTTPGASR